MKRYKKWMTILLASSLFLGGCGIQTTQIDEEEKEQNNQNENVIAAKQEGERLEFDYQIDPETFGVTVEYNGKVLPVSLPLPKREVVELKREGQLMSWVYPQDEIKVVVEKIDDYLDVAITSLKEEDNQFVWPKVEGESYVLPLREGKYIPQNDTYWKSYLDGETLELIESLSMRFFGVNQGEYSVLYVMDDLYHSQMVFGTEENITFDVQHKYNSMNPDRTYGFRIYVTPQNPVDMAKVYKSYLVEKGEFKTLSEKAKINPNIEKLYGAVHLYLWDSYVISEENIKWEAMKTAISGEVVGWIKTLLKEVEDGAEVIAVFDTIAEQDYIDQYQKNVICKAITNVVALPKFYNPKVFTEKNQKITSLLNQGVDKLNQVEIIELNKQLLKANLPEVFEPVEDWADTRGVDILNEMKSEGIETAWIGLDNWMQGMMKPELVEYAVEAGYLIGPYDSYHSIHAPGEEKWHTAIFTDKTLYERGTVQKKNGEYEKGFQGEGRKLNPTLAMDSVKERVEGILATGLPFNSWFIDCDATGEIYDDYAPEHETTAQQDLQARLERMAYFSEEKDMVVGSEGGNDFASTTIALAHGIELPSFSWMDEDMKNNKDSDYYMGKYYSPKGGVPERFAKQVPVKDDYKKIFLDQAYNLPLFKLVYNDSLITTYHWEWSTFKIADEVPHRMLYEILYNVPPLYHLDKWEWGKYKDQIVSHSKMYADFSKKVINEEMTDFKVLSEDRLVQMTVYGDKVKVIANFSEKTFNYEGNKVEPNALMIQEGDSKKYYKV